MQLSTLLSTTILLIAVSAAPLEPRQSGYLPSGPELRYCANPLNTFACYKARGHANEASKAAAANFPANSLHNGKGDAFRHCYWNARMAIDIGVKKAKEIATRHEDGSTGPQREKNMDLANNETGRGIGVRTKTYGKALNECRNKARNGGLVVIG
ncbi:secreted protein [Pyronema omphalodes]|nr:secreted protein [Pyronema omphalodes]